VRQTDSVHTSNVSYLYYLSRIKGKIIDEMNGNYTGNERSRAVKLRAAVLGVADIARARNPRFNFPTYPSSERSSMSPYLQSYATVLNNPHAAISRTVIRL